RPTAPRTTRPPSTRIPDSPELPASHRDQQVNPLAHRVRRFPATCYGRVLMRDPWGLNERLFAFYYPKVCALAENAGQREIRRKLIGGARGRTLELGAGSGLNLPHYTRAVSELVVTEPSPHMLEHLGSALERDGSAAGSWE